MAPSSGHPRRDFFMKSPTTKPNLRCAIYTRVSTDARLEQEFNSLDAQREASEAYIKSQTHEGWSLVRARYDDGGFSSGSMERPALQKLLLDVQAKRIDVIVVYKVDRLTRSLADFAKLVEMFDAHGVSFVSVTQSFNTTTSMGRLTLNVLLSFAQFEREVTGERIRDKIAASKKKGIWMGGVVPLGYRVEGRALHIVEDHAELVRGLFKRYLDVGSVARLKERLDAEDVRLPIRLDGKGRSTGGGLFSRGHIYKIFSNPIYIGQIAHKGLVHEGQHSAIVDRELWEKVQQSLEGNLIAKTQRRERQSSNALLVGKLFDDRGNLMTRQAGRSGDRSVGAIISPKRSCAATRPTPDRLRGFRRRRSRAGSLMQSAAWTKGKARPPFIRAAIFLATTFRRPRTQIRRPTITNAFVPALSASLWRGLRSASLYPTTPIRERRRKSWPSHGRCHRPIAGARLSRV